MEGSFRIKTLVDGDRCVLALTGEVDLDVADDLLQVGQIGLDEAGVIGVVLDLAEVTFMDSSALGAMVALHNIADERHQSLTLAHVPDRVRKILAITGLDATFEEIDLPEAEAI